MTGTARPSPTPLAAPNPWLPRTVTIRDIHQELPGVATYDLALRDARDGTFGRFAPGQFNMLYLPGAGEIAISISDDPLRTGGCRHTVRVAGNVTRTLATLQVGDTLGLRGPFGRGWPLAECIGRDVVLVAGGIGLAPLRPAIYQLLQQRRQFGRLHLLYGARTPDTRLYAAELPQWTRAGLQVETTVDRASPGWNGHVGVVTLLLERLANFDPRNTVLLCCGPEVMMRFTILAGIGRGLSHTQIWVSLERNMRCAIGHCGHCQLGPEFLCKDGPVFRYDRVARLLETEAL